jgi:hypothetical protein
MCEGSDRTFGSPWLCGLGSRTDLEGSGPVHVQMVGFVQGLRRCGPLPGFALKAYLERAAASRG